MKRNEGLQGLRGFAFLLIFLSHTGVLGGRLGLLGAFGVSIFIVLSGAITGIKYDSNEISPVSFIFSRIKKIYPLHIVTLLAALPFSIVAIKNGSETLWKFFMRLSANLTLTQAFVPIVSVYFSLNAVAWYLTLVVVFSFFTKPLLRICEKITMYGGGEVSND